MSDMGTPPRKRGALKPRGLNFTPLQDAGNELERPMSTQPIIPKTVAELRGRKAEGRDRLSQRSASAPARRVERVYEEGPTLTLDTWRPPPEPTSDPLHVSIDDILPPPAAAPADDAGSTASEDMPHISDFNFPAAPLEASGSPGSGAASAGSPPQPRRSPRPSGSPPDPPPDVGSPLTPQRRRRPAANRSRSACSATSRSPAEFTHLFGKSWASRVALPDANHRSATQRLQFRPLWETDCYYVVPSGVGRMGVRRSQSATPVFRSAVPRLAMERAPNPHLGPGAYHIPDYVDKRGPGHRFADALDAPPNTRVPKPRPVAALDRCSIPRASERATNGVGTPRARCSFPKPAADLRGRPTRGPLACPVPTPEKSRRSASAPRSGHRLTAKNISALELPGPARPVSAAAPSGSTPRGFGSAAPRFRPPRGGDAPAPGTYEVLW